MCDDARVQWLAAHIAAHCNSPDTTNIQLSLTSSKNLTALTSFLDSSITVLLATTHCSDATVHVSLETSLSAHSTSGASKLTFVKTVSSALTAADLTAKVLVTSLSNNSPTSLFHVLHNVYIPLLSSTNQQISPNLAALLSQVNVQLGKESAVEQEHDPLGDISTIATAIDEVRSKLPVGMP
jgi:hypothetical protein